MAMLPRVTTAGWMSAWTNASESTAGEDATVAGTSSAAAAGVMTSCLGVSECTLEESATVVGGVEPDEDATPLEDDSVMTAKKLFSTDKDMARSTPESMLSLQRASSSQCREERVSSWEGGGTRGGGCSVQGRDATERRIETFVAWAILTDRPEERNEQENRGHGTQERAKRRGTARARNVRLRGRDG